MDQQCILRVEKFYKELDAIDFPFLPINECEISYKTPLRGYVPIHYGGNSKIKVIYRNYSHFKRYTKYIGTNLCCVEMQPDEKIYPKVEFVFVHDYLQHDFLSRTYCKVKLYKKTIENNFKLKKSYETPFETNFGKSGFAPNIIPDERICFACWCHRIDGLFYEVRFQANCDGGIPSFPSTITSLRDFHFDTMKVEVEKHYFNRNDVQKCINVIKAIEKYYKFMAKTNHSCLEPMFIRSTQQKNALKTESSRYEDERDFPRLFDELAKSENLWSINERDEYIDKKMKQTKMVDPKREFDNNADVVKKYIKKVLQNRQKYRKIKCSAI